MKDGKAALDQLRASIQIRNVSVCVYTLLNGKGSTDSLAINTECGKGSSYSLTFAGVK